MANRVRDLKLLSRERWQAHVAAQGGEAGAAVGGATMALTPPQPPMPAPTAGALFNRPNPMNEAGEFVLPYVRGRNKFVDFRGEQHWVDKNGFAIDTPKEGKNWQSNRRYVPVSGKDWTSLKISSVERQGLDLAQDQLRLQVPHPQHLGGEQGGRHQELPLLRLPAHRGAVDLVR